MTGASSGQRSLTEWWEAMKSTHACKHTNSCASEGDAMSGATQTAFQLFRCRCPAGAAATESHCRDHQAPIPLPRGLVLRFVVGRSCNAASRSCESASVGPLLHARRTTIKDTPVRHEPSQQWFGEQRPVLDILDAPFDQRCLPHVRNGALIHKLTDSPLLLSSLSRRNASDHGRSLCASASPDLSSNPHATHHMRRGAEACRTRQHSDLLGAAPGCHSSGGGSLGRAMALRW